VWEPEGAMLWVSTGGEGGLNRKGERKESARVKAVWGSGGGTDPLIILIRGGRGGNKKW